MTRRLALTAVACLSFALTPSFALSQVKQAAPTTQATPPAPAKWVPPIKTGGTVEFTQEKPKRVGSEIHTKLKVRNTSKGALALLSVEELWYNTKREIASNGTYKHKALLNPGDSIEFTIVSPVKPDLYTNMLMFKHAYGTIEAKRVPKLQ
jgi:hypothetical protein